MEQSFEIIAVLLGKLITEAADAAVEVALHQRLKGREVAPLDGVDEVVVVGHHFGEAAGRQAWAFCSVRQRYILPMAENHVSCSRVSAS